MSRQEGKSAMEEMLASIREAIHEEAAHQAVGLHAPLRVRAAHEAPVMRPDNDQAEEAETPPFLKPLSEDMPETTWIDPAAPEQNRVAIRGEQGTLTEHDATNGKGVRDEIGEAPFAPRKKLLEKELPSVGGIMSGKGTPPAVAPSLAQTPEAEGDAMFDGSLDAAWWPEEETRQVADKEDAVEEVPYAGVTDETEPLVSPQTGELAARAFDMLREELALPEDLRSMTEEMLRPMLREWLDANLPELVERLVREEITRIAHGAPSRRMR